MIKVAVFEDNYGLRDSLTELLTCCEELEVTGAFPNASKLLMELSENLPDVVLMDINMPGISGIEATAIIKNAFPEIHILMQTVFEEDDKIFASVCAGASGYVLKNTPPLKLIEAIKEIAAGGAVFTPSIAKRILLMAAQTSPGKAEYIDLSKREKEVLQKLVDGLSYKMIAAQLNIAFDTVHSHIKNIYEKLHVNSKGEAVAKAIRQKLV